jgi:hypothetical protein
MTIRAAGAAILICGVYFLWAAVQPDANKSAPAKVKSSAVAPANLCRYV